MAGRTWTQQVFDKLIARGNTGKLVEAGAALTLSGQAPKPYSPPAIRVVVDFEKPHEGAGLRVTVRTDHLRAEEEEDATAEIVASWLVPVTRQLNAAWRFVTADTGQSWNSTPYDEWFAVYDGASKAENIHAATTGPTC